MRVIKAMLELLLCDGARVTELVSLRLNMSVQQGVVRVIGKGNKERFIANGEEAAQWVRQFMLCGRPVLRGQSSDVVFQIWRTASDSSNFLAS